MTKRIKKYLVIFVFSLVSLLTLAGCQKSFNIKQTLETEQPDIAADFYDQEGNVITEAKKDQDLVIKFNIPTDKVVKSFTVDGEDKISSLQDGSFTFKFNGQKLPKFNIEFVDKEKDPIVSKVLIKVNGIEQSVDGTSIISLNDNYNKDTKTILEGKTLKLQVNSTSELEKISKILFNGEEITLDTQSNVQLIEKVIPALTQTLIEITTVQIAETILVVKLNGVEQKIDGSTIISLSTELDQQNQTIAFDKDVKLQVNPGDLQKVTKIVFNGEELPITDDVTNLSQVINKPAPHKIQTLIEITTEKITKNTVKFLVNGTEKKIDNVMLINSSSDFNENDNTIEFNKFIRFEINPGEQKKVTKILFNGKERELQTNPRVFTQTQKIKVPRKALSIIEITIEDIKINFPSLPENDFEFVGLNGVKANDFAQVSQTLKLGDEVFFFCKNHVTTQLQYLDKFIVTGENRLSISKKKLKKSIDNSQEEEINDCLSFKIDVENVVVEYEYTQYIDVSIKTSNNDDSIYELVVDKNSLREEGTKKLIKKGTKFIIKTREWITFRRIEFRVNVEPITNILGDLQNNELKLTATDNGNLITHTMSIKFLVYNPDIAIINFEIDAFNYVTLEIKGTSSDEANNLLKKYQKKFKKTGEIEIDKTKANFLLTIPELVPTKEQDGNGHFQFKTIVKLLINGEDKTKELLNSPDFNFKLILDQDTNIKIEVKEYKKNGWSDTGNIKTAILASDSFAIVNNFTNEVGTEGSGKQYIISGQDFDQLKPLVENILIRINGLPEEMTSENVRQALKLSYQLNELANIIKKVTGR